ncbi:MAG: aminopeptidase P family protein [Chloroflexota bacterium]|nr:aminopeptidase P family protein [Chloroflexota bacterium]MDE2941023.1 aminopeptidase P family protein [Chloroflexota bacterium]MDE3268209.1 aminopeptidase P family protein [Chloroflexota bacterium]
MTSKLDALRARFESSEIDGILIGSDENRRYVSGFSGTAGNLIITSDAAVLATDFRYIEQAGQQAPDFRVLRVAGGGSDWLTNLLKELGVSRLGFESQHMTVATHERLSKAFAEAGNGSGVELVPTAGLIEELRSVKDEAEMALLTRAIEISDRAFEEVSRILKDGMTEREVAWLLERTMRELGADSVSFDTIVAAGPNAALPHHRADDTPLRDGQPLIIDMGARYEGYCSDLSRTLSIGHEDDTFREVYTTVLRAQQTAIDGVRSGMTAGEADGLARAVIEEAGYGDKFGHSLGHGVGLEIHERPGVGPNSPVVLEDGMPFTIEPGIYISGWGGVRIEDIVVLEDGKARVISNAPKID